MDWVEFSCWFAAMCMAAFVYQVRRLVLNLDDRLTEEEAKIERVIRAFDGDDDALDKIVAAIHPNGLTAQRMREVLNGS
jgi:hypothetical protein